MNRILLVLIIVGVIAAMAWSLWAGHKKSVVTVNPHPAPVEVVMSQNWQEVRAARATALKDSPDLAAEYQELLVAMADQRKQLDAAMIKADPKVAPIIAKLALGNASNTTLMPAEKRELNIARQMALKINPDWEAKSAQLSIDMAKFRSNFSQAMIKTDPRVDPMLAKLGDQPKGAKLPTPSPKTP